MAKLYKGDKLFPLVIKPSGAAPLDDRAVVQSFSDLTNSSTFFVSGSLAAYNGMLVAVIDDQQVYMLIDVDNITSEDSWVAVGSGNGSLAVNTYGEAIALASEDNIGQVIYVTTKSSYDPDGEEGEKPAVEYEAAPYIVIGTGKLMKLAASETNTGNVVNDIAELQTKVSGLETAVGKDGEEPSGLYKKIVDAQDAAEATAAADATSKANAAQSAAEATAAADATSKANAAQSAAIEEAGRLASAAQTAAESHADGLNTAMNTRVEALEAIDHEHANKDVLDGITAAKVEAWDAAEQNAKDYADGLNTEMNGRIEALEAIDHDHTNKAVLDGITAEKVANWNKAQANVIEKIVFNGDEVVVDEQTKTVTLNTPADFITELGANEKVLSVDGRKLSSTISLNYYTGKNEEGATVYEIQLVGKDDTVIGRIDAKDFVKDGMLSDVELVKDPSDKPAGTYLVFTWNNEAGKTDPMYVPVTDLLDVYAAGNGLALDGKTFSLVVKENEKYLEVTNAGIATKGIDDAITLAKNAILGADSDAASAGTIFGAKKYADEVAAAAESAAIEEAGKLADAAESAAIEEAGKLADAAESAAIEEAGKLASAAQTAAEGYADGLNTAMNTRVEALEAIDHEHDNKDVLDGITAAKVEAWDAAEQNAKDYADETFVKLEGFNAFAEEMETKLDGIEANAEVNVIESIKVNGVASTLGEGKVAEVTVNGNDIALGKDIMGDVKDEKGNVIGQEVVYGSTVAISDVLQGIQDSIAVAVSGGLTGVVGGNGIEVSAVAANKQTVSVKVSTAEGNLISADQNGIFAAMYYDGDDAE